MVLLAVVVADARAAGFEVAEQSAVAGGTGHASTARDADAAAAWFDPAALADDAGPRLAVGVVVAGSTVRATSTGPSPWEVTSDNPIGTPPHLYASLAGRGLLAGVAVGTPFAGGVRWPDASPLRFENLESEPVFFRVAPFVGGRVGPVRVAGGLHVDMGSLTVRQATDHVVDEGLATLSLRGSGVGADAAVFVRLDPVAVGLSYKSRTRLPLSGEADFDVPVAFQAQLPDQTLTSAWRLPDRVALGETVDVAGFRILFDQIVTAWSVNDALDIDFADPATPDVHQVNQWQDTLALRLGAERGVAEVGTVRLGGYVDGIGLDGRGPALVPADSLGPSAPDGIRLGATGGGGIAIGPVRADVFAEYLAILAREADGPEVPSAAYRGHAVAGGVTVGVARRPPRRPVPAGRTAPPK